MVQSELVLATTPKTHYLCRSNKTLSLSRIFSQVKLRIGLCTTGTFEYPDFKEISDAHIVCGKDNYVSEAHRVGRNLEGMVNWRITY